MTTQPVAAIGLKALVELQVERFGASLRLDDPYVDACVAPEESEANSEAERVCEEEPEEAPVLTGESVAEAG
jgi:hypothetical protein